MKRFYVSILIGMTALFLFACGKKENASDLDPNELVQQDGNGQAEADTQEGMAEDTAAAQTGELTGADDMNAAEGMEGNEAAQGGTNAENEDQTTDGTPAQVLLADFLDKMDGDQIAKTEDMANALIANPIIPFDGATMPVEPGFLNGFTEEIKGFSEGTMFGPAIGAIPFVGYIFKVDGDVDAFMQELKDKSDMRWNVCTQADETVVEAHGDTVFFLMAPATFEE